jgi:hypothetical protein
LRKTIICIHGLGNKPSKELLTKWWRLAIREGLIGIGWYVFNPKIEMVYWADILYEKPLDEKITDSKDPFYLNDRYTKSSKTFVAKNNENRKKVLDFVGRQLDKLFLNEDNTINYGSITDLVISKYFKDLGIYYNHEPGLNTDIYPTAKDAIRERLIELLNVHKKDEIFLIAHSMGSVVAYDVLTLQLTNAKVNTLTTIGAPLGVPIVISKIAAEYKEKFNEAFIPSTPPNVTKNWYNFSDLRDKVALDYELADDFKENVNGIKPIDYIVDNTYIVHQEANPHKAYGYLRTPEFSKVMLEFLILNKSKITIWFLDVMNKAVIWMMKKNIKFLEKINPFLLDGTEL